jgi:hypothetical protein
MLKSILIFLTLTGAAVAEDGWAPLTGDAALKALSGHRLAYPAGATQSFAPSGDTSYDSGHLQAGRWRIDGDEYCSVWPPSDLWSCYQLEMSADGSALRFIAADGSVTEGHFVGN